MWKRWLGLSQGERRPDSPEWEHRSKWNLGILSDKETDEVPGKCDHGANTVPIGRGRSLTGSNRDRLVVNLKSK